MAEAIPVEQPRLQRVAALLGGARLLKHALQTDMDAHEMLLHGLPVDAAHHFVNALAFIKPADAVEKAMGMSLRTYQRLKEQPSRVLSQEQSGRTWKFAEILSKATELLGSQDDAERWMETPAMGLDRHRPIDLLATPAGVELVEIFLKRLEYGVYV